MPSSQNDYGGLDLLTTGSDSFEALDIALLADPQVQIGHLKKCRRQLEDRTLAFNVILGDLTDRSLRKEFGWIAEERTVMQALDQIRSPIRGRQDSAGLQVDLDFPSILALHFYDATRRS